MVDFGYAAVEVGTRLAGIVPGGTFLRLRYTDSGSGPVFAQTQPAGDNRFFIPFTEGSHEAIERRQPMIQGVFLGPGNFLGFPAPSFGFEMPSEKTVRVSLSYEDIFLTGFDDELAPGTYRLTIRNEGRWNGDVNVSVSVD